MTWSMQTIRFANRCCFRKIRSVMVLGDLHTRYTNMQKAQHVHSFMSCTGMKFIVIGTALLASLHFLPLISAVVACACTCTTVTVVQPLSQHYFQSHSRSFLFEVIRWAYFRVINDPVQQLVACGHIFEGGHIIRRLRYIACACFRLFSSP